MPFEDFFAEDGSFLLNGGIVQVLYGQDWIRPLVISRVPAGGSPNIGLSPVISVTFDEPVYPVSGGEVLLKLPTSPVESFHVETDVSFSGGTLTFTPSEQLLPGRFYEVIFFDGVVTDAVGNGNRDFTWNFFTGDLEDVIFGDGFEP